MIDQLIRFASRYDNDFPNKIKGISEEEINYLQQLAERPVPGIYQEFLRRMGSDIGDIGPSAVDFGYSRIRSLVQDQENEYHWPQQYLVIGEGLQDPYYNYFLDLSTVNSGDCAVVKFDIELNAAHYNKDHICQEAPSFESFLFDMVFLSKYLFRFTHNTWGSHKAKRIITEDALLTFSTIAKDWNFEILGPAKPNTLMLNRDDAVLYIRFHGEIIRFQLTSKNERDIWSVRHSLEELLRDNF